MGIMNASVQPIPRQSAAEAHPSSWQQCHMTNVRPEGKAGSDSSCQTPPLWCWLSGGRKRERRLKMSISRKFQYEHFQKAHDPMQYLNIPLHVPKRMYLN